MDDELPIVGVGVDYTKVGPIHPKKTLTLVNHFVTHTTHFLNKFAVVCEEKLEVLHGKLHQMEVVLSILEAKLSSIPGLENVSAPAIDQSTAKINEFTTTTKTESLPPSEPLSLQPNPVVAEETKGSKETEIKEAKVEEPKLITVARDPQYAKYFKLVNMGVPIPALSQKMISEGLDPELLKNPDAPIPNKSKTQNDDSDFSSDSDSINE